MSGTEVLKPYSEYRPYEPLVDPRSKVLVSEGEILHQLPFLGEALGKIIPTLRRPLLVWIAKGGQLFAEDLISHIPRVDGLPDFDVAVIQYRSRVGVDQVSQTGIMLDESEYPFPDVEGRDIIGIDDVLDSAETTCEFIAEVARRGGKVTDFVVASEKPVVDKFKGKVRTHSIPEEIRTWALNRVPALWLYGYGMDNGNESTEVKDRAVRDIRVNWAFEKEHNPEAYAFYLKQALLRDPEAAKRLG